MKRLRRLAIVLAGMLLLSVIAGAYVAHRAHEAPAWYHPLALDTETQRMAANDVDQNLFKTYTAASAPHEVQLPAIPLCLTENGMNSWAHKWESKLQWKKTLGSRLQDPIIVVQDRELILAATLVEWNTVVSLHFEPRLQDGKLNLTLTKVMSGTLPLPRWAWSRYADKAAAVAEKNLPALQRDAEIDPRGRANSAAVDAAMSEMLLHVLRGEPSEPVLFLPEPEHKGRSVIVQITRVDISNKQLTLQLEPMSFEQHEAFLQQLRGPGQTSIGMGK